MKETAKDFLARCFAPGETIALLLRTESPAKTQQRVVTLEQALAPRYLGWLAHENHHGANVYVAANPLRPGSRKRTKECIASIRHVYIDIDEDGDARLAALRASDAVPPVPSAILSTSPGKYQVLWRVDGLRLCHAGRHSQAARHRLRRRSGLHRLQPGASHPRFPQSEVFSCSLRSGRISLRRNLTVLRTSACRKPPSWPRCRFAGTRGISSGTKTAIPSRIGRGSATSLPRAKMPAS